MANENGRKQIEPTTNTRELVLDILLEVTKNNVYSHQAIRRMLAKYQYLNKQDRAFITRLAEGSIERMIQIDYIINQVSSVNTSKMKPVILNILRLSVYQIHFMERVPDSAACNEGVKLAIKRGFKNLKGFVNGVLRNISRKKESVEYPNREKDIEEYLSITYSMPKWIINKWKKQYDYGIIEKILESFLKQTDTTVRCNTSKATVDEIINMLQQEGVTVERCPYYDKALWISEYDYLGSLETFSKGYITIQDISSMLVGKIADPKKNDYVIDVCAAPGGKSIHIADMLEGTGMVEARDVSDYKVELIEDTILRTGFENISTLIMDATEMDSDSVDKADIVIADLPCSGLGVIGNKTDLKYKMTYENQKELVELQKSILSVIHEYVKVGGSLVYSTCTINVDENEKIIEWFTSEFPFELTSIEQYIPEELSEDTAKKGYMQFLPGQHKTAGFFIAKFIKGA